MEFQVFAKEGCELCRKARSVLEHVGVEPQVRYVDGPNATPEDLADFAWYDWTDKPPLVVATESGRTLRRWDGRDIQEAWLPHLRQWLAGRDAGLSSSGIACERTPVE
ncbi:glutaredoxin [candidate division WOR-3 bacterium]|nr:glutaredoxin [candidate division WOR-3 bacterium]